MRKVGLLILALVIALGTLGVGYAKWSDTVIINGTIESGNVCIKFDGSGTNVDPCATGYLDYTVVKDKDGNWVVADPIDQDLIYNLEPKNVGCTTKTLSDDGKTLTVTLTNVYPGYLADLELHLRNCGTIPVKIEGFTYTAVSSTCGDSFCISGADYDWKTPGPCQLLVKYANDNQAVQIHPGEYTTSSFLVLVDQSAKQGCTYTFTININAAQWNEVPAATITPVYTPIPN
jgi:hypothetical protein